MNSNIRKGKYTTGTGLALIAIIIAKLITGDMADIKAMPTMDLALYIGAALNGVLSLFAKDPKQK